MNLNLSQLNEFENYMRSGQLERDFKNGDDNKRFEILEILEKLMDMAELGDEIATHLIFPGLRTASKT